MYVVKNKERWCNASIIVPVALTDVPHSRAVNGDVDSCHALYRADLKELGRVEQNGDDHAAKDVTPEKQIQFGFNVKL